MAAAAMTMMIMMNSLRRERDRFSMSQCVALLDFYGKFRAPCRENLPLQKWTWGPSPSNSIQYDEAIYWT